MEHNHQKPGLYPAWLSCRFPRLLVVAHLCVLGRINTPLLWVADRVAFAVNLKHAGADS